MGGIVGFPPPEVPQIVKFTGGYIVITERSHRRAAGPNPRPRRLKLWASDGVVIRNFS